MKRDTIFDEIRGHLVLDVPDKTISKYINEVESKDSKVISEEIYNDIVKAKEKIKELTSKELTDLEVVLVTKDLGQEDECRFDLSEEHHNRLKNAVNTWIGYRKISKKSCIVKEKKKEDNYYYDREANKNNVAKINSNKATAKVREEKKAVELETEKNRSIENIVRDKCAVNIPQKLLTSLISGKEGCVASFEECAKAIVEQLDSMVNRDRVVLGKLLGRTPTDEELNRVVESSGVNVFELEGINLERDPMDILDLEDGEMTVDEFTAKYEINSEEVIEMINESLEDEKEPTK